MTSGRGHVAIVKKLGLRWLGLPPLTRGRSRVTYLVTGRRQGRSRYPAGCATGNRKSLPNRGPLLLGHFHSLTTNVLFPDFAPRLVNCSILKRFTFSLLFSCCYVYQCPTKTGIFQCNTARKTEFCVIMEEEITYIPVSSHTKLFAPPWAVCDMK